MNESVSRFSYFRVENVPFKCKHFMEILNKTMQFPRFEAEASFFHERDEAVIIVP